MSEENPPSSRGTGFLFLLLPVVLLIVGVLCVWFAVREQAVDAANLPRIRPDEIYPQQREVGNVRQENVSYNAGRDTAVSVKASLHPEKSMAWVASKDGYACYESGKVLPTLRFAGRTPAPAASSASGVWVALPFADRVDIVRCDDTARVPKVALSLRPSPDQDRDASPMSAAFFGDALLYVGWMRGDGSGFVEEYACRSASGNRFERTQVLEPEYAERMDAFGRHVTVTDCVLFVSDLTSVTVFFRTVAGARWVRSRTLPPPSSASVPFLFGMRTLARTATRDLVIASPFETVDGYEYAGRVHLLPWSSSTSSSTRTKNTAMRMAISSPRPDEDDQFGTDVAFDGQVLWVASRHAIYGFHTDHVMTTEPRKENNRTDDVTHEWLVQDGSPQPVATVALSDTVSLSACVGCDTLWAAGSYGLRSFSISTLLHRPPSLGDHVSPAASGDGGSARSGDTSCTSSGTCKT